MCSSLTSITLPVSTKTLGASAFQNTGLTVISIPASLTSIGNNAFSGCSELANVRYFGTPEQWSAITFGSGNEALTSASIKYLIDAGVCGADLRWELDVEGVLTVSGSGTMWDSSNAQTLSVWSKYANSIKSLVIENGVTGIGKWAFYGCSALESAVIPGTVSTVGYHVFESCSGLADFSLSEGVETIASGAFRFCDSLQTLTFPESLRSIGIDAFHNCTGLTKVVIPAGVTTCDDQAFSGCTGLLTAGPIGSGCSVEYGWTDTIPNFALNNIPNLLSVTLPDGLTTLSSGAFAYCSALESIIIPASVTTVGEYTFYSCTKLKTVYYEGTYNQWQSLANQNTTLKNATVYYRYGYGSWDNLAWVDYGGQLFISGTGKMTDFTYDSSSAWRQDIDSVTSVVIGEGVTSIGSNAFRNFTHLRSVTIPESVSSIGESAFSGCSGLTSVTIPDSVISIGRYAFSNCSGLTGVTIPESVTSIGDEVFSNCSALTDIFFAGPAERWDTLTAGHSNVVPDGTTVHCGRHNIVLQPIVNGEVEILLSGDSASVAFDSETITLVLRPDTGYELASLSVMHNGEPTAVTEGDENTYIFIMPADDVTVTVSFQPQSYTVTWLNEDGSLIVTTTVEYGTVPTHADPAKAATAEYTYSFAGWTPEIAAVTGEATYTATFDATKNSYTVTWLNDDDSVIDTTTVEYGVVPTHADPTKEATAEYTYTFAGWTPEIAAVTGETTYTATFDATKNSYTVTWLNDDGSVIDTTMVEYGVVPTHAEPTKAATAEYTYTFAGWTPEITAVTGEATYTATFSAEKNSYAITVLNDGSDGTIAAPESARFGDEVVVTVTPADGRVIGSVAYSADEKIELQPDENGVCCFTMPAHAVTVEAAFEYIRYSVSYDANGGDNTPAAQTKLWGETLLLTDAVPTREGWYFLGWGEDDEAEKPDYQPGAEYTADADVTLYAVWAKPDIVLPAALTAVEDEAFEQAAFTFVQLPATVSSIGRRAFADCPRLVSIVISASDTVIDPEAFAGVTELTVFGLHNSTAESFAQAHGFTFRTID